MKLHNLAFATLVAGVGLSSVAQAQYQPSYPPPSAPPDSGYQNQGNYPDNQGYSNQGDDQGYDNQQPYYDPRPDGNYGDPYNDPNYSQAYSQDYGNQGPVDQSVFYSELSPYGRWIQRGSYGWVWEPTQVAVGWRPYTQGHWVDTDYGWTWVSSEPWGWATYHYGRWTLDSEYGWLWVPGSDWGPAWVSFQEGGGYVGWAPLPPAVGFRAGIGIQIGGFSLSASIDPYAYSFVPERSFLDDRLEIEPPARNVTFIHQTRNITNITVVNNRVFNRGIEEQRIAQVTGRPVRHYQIAESRNPAQGRVAQVQGDRVQIFRPAVELAKPRPDMTPAIAMQRRQQRVQQVQPGQPAVQPGRQVQPGQVQAGQQPQVRQPGNGRPMVAPEDIPRKHQAEQQQLQARQDAERNRLMQAQQQEQSARQNDRTVAAQHQAEQQALQQQQQREQQMLQARHQREQQAAQSRPQQRQERQNQQQQRQQEQQQQRQQRQENRREQRDQPPPPPPPV